MTILNESEQTHKVLNKNKVRAQCFDKGSNSFAHISYHRAFRLKITTYS